MSESTTGVPSGMYPDPENPGKSRYWDGSRWGPVVGDSAIGGGISDLTIQWTRRFQAVSTACRFLDQCHDMDVQQAVAFLDDPEISEDMAWGVMACFFGVAATVPSVRSGLEFYSATFATTPGSRTAFQSALAAIDSGKSDLYNGGTPAGQLFLLLSLSQIIFETPDGMRTVSENAALMGYCWPDEGTQSKPPAGWLLDPWDDRQLRYWNGNAWTGQVSLV
jgi:hypothetical protein